MALDHDNPKLKEDFSCCDAAAVRSCSVPANKALLFPMVNGIFNNVPPEGFSVAEKRRLLEELLSDTAPGFLADLGFPGTQIFQPRALLDGEPIVYANPMARVQSPPFFIDSGDDPPFGLPPNLVDAESVSDGIWVMLPPLAPGVHVLEFGGRFCEFDSFADHPLLPPVSIKYELTVVARDRE